MTGTFAAVFVALYVAHTIGDHWVQTKHQACTKGEPGWSGRLACAAHVATYTATGLAALIAVALICRVTLAPTAVTAGLAVSAITHYFADRRAPLLRIAEALQAGWGRADFYRMQIHRPAVAGNAAFVDQYGPGTGAYALDQSWHVGWLFIAALIIA